MTLKLRLLAGYGYLVALLLLAAGGAMLGFLDLSERIALALEENFRSVEAAMRMIETLERQDSATLAALIEEAAEGEEMAAFEAQFEEALGVARDNVTEEAERPVLEELERHFAGYREARRALLASRPERPLAAYERQVLPRFAEVKGDLLRLLDLNQDAIAEAEREARQVALHNGAWLGFLVTIALVSLVLLSRGLQRQILSRLEALRQGMGRITRGDLGRRLSERGNDELTAIARHFNEILDRRQQEERRLAGRLAQERRLILGLAEQFGDGVELYDLSGERLTLAVDAAGAGGETVAAWLRQEGRRRLAGAETFPEPVREEIETEKGGRVEVRLLTSGAGRPVAWMARRP